MGIDFGNLSPEQDKLLREILSTCRCLRFACKNNVSDDVLVKQAQDLGFKYSQLERVS